MYLGSDHVNLCIVTNTSNHRLWFHVHAWVILRHVSLFLVSREFVINTVYLYNCPAIFFSGRLLVVALGPRASHYKYIDLCGSSETDAMYLHGMLGCYKRKTSLMSMPTCSASLDNQMHKHCACKTLHMYCWRHILNWLVFRWLPTFSTVKMPMRLQLNWAFVHPQDIVKSGSRHSLFDIFLSKSPSTSLCWPHD